MKNQTVCFTGHRYISKKDNEKIQQNLETIIISLINKGALYFGAGGALGFDTIAAQTVLKLRERFTHIRLILILPCKNQTNNWTEKDIKIYNQIMREADKVVYTSENYFKGCMHKRNRHLVNNSSVCVCYFNKNSGGTAYTVNYAKDKNLEIINLAELCIGMPERSLL